MRVGKDMSAVDSLDDPALAACVAGQASVMLSATALVRTRWPSE